MSFPAVGLRLLARIQYPTTAANAHNLTNSSFRRLSNGNQTWILYGILLAHHRIPWNEGLSSLMCLISATREFQEFAGQAEDCGDVRAHSCAHGPLTFIRYFRRPGG